MFYFLSRLFEKISIVNAMNAITAPRINGALCEEYCQRYPAINEAGREARAMNMWNVPIEVPSSFLFARSEANALSLLTMNA